MTALLFACGGTTGREGLPALPSDGTDGSVASIDASPLDASEAGHSHRDASRPDVGIVGAGAGDDGGADDAGNPDAPWRTDSPTCDACLAANCPANGIPFPPCSGVQGLAADGPSAGVPRLELCEQVYACIERAKCHVSGTASPCYCGTASGASCLNPGAANGVCKAQIEAGEESTDPGAIVTGFGNTDLGAGAAIAALQCAIDNCFDVCVAPADAGQ